MRPPETGRTLNHVTRIVKPGANDLEVEVRANAGGCCGIVGTPVAIAPSVSGLFGPGRLVARWGEGVARRLVRLHHREWREHDPPCRSGARLTYNHNQGVTALDIVLLQRLCNTFDRYLEDGPCPREWFLHHLKVLTSGKELSPARHEKTRTWPTLLSSHFPVSQSK